MAGFDWKFATKAEKRPKTPRLRDNATCADCGAFLENWTTYYRCPWTTRARRFSSSVDGVQAITCGWVAAAPRTEITAPISGKRA